MKNKWKNNATSPVLFFIDDLCNKWIDLNGDGKIQPEEDWGHAGFGKNGSFEFLENEILSVNPNIKTTFFVPVGKRVDLLEEHDYNVFSKKINYDDKAIEFYQEIDKNDKYELAYHGTTHGIPKNDEHGFIQEWESYESFEEAIETIELGKKIYRDTLGKNPSGGKYPGYISNKFSDESIDKSGFKWWCRYYNRGAVDGLKGRDYGNDSNPLTAFNIKYFGKNKVIDIPTTISGSLLNSVFKPTKGIKGILKKILKPILIRLKLRKIDYLIKNNLIISIQEHMSPSRVDGKSQSPNIFDDKESLKTIFKYLEKKNVWYCTGSELAEWVKENK